MDLRENEYIKFPIQLEQYLMEGTYRKVEEVPHRPILHAVSRHGRTARSQEQDACHVLHFCAPTFSARCAKRQRVSPCEMGCRRRRGFRRRHIHFSSASSPALCATLSPTGSSSQRRSSSLCQARWKREREHGGTKLPEGRELWKGAGPLRFLVVCPRSAHSTMQ